MLKEKAIEIKNTIDNIPGLVDLNTEQALGQPQIQVIADRSACARYGVTVGEILEIVELAVGGEVVDNIYLNTRGSISTFAIRRLTERTPNPLGIC